VHILSESGETLVNISNFYVRALMPPPPGIATNERARLSMAVNS
jgi:hypothetical protein